MFHSPWANPYAVIRMRRPLPVCMMGINKAAWSWQLHLNCVWTLESYRSRQFFSSLVNYYYDTRESF